MAEPGGAARRRGVAVSSVDSEAFDGAGVSKGELIAYLDAMADQLITELSGRALSVVRARPGSDPFMQKNLPKHAPDWIASESVWAASSQRTVRYPIADEARTLVWLGNQRAVEFHPSLLRVDQDRVEELVLDLDPPATGDVAGDFARAAEVAQLVRRALTDCGLTGQVKTSGAKGLHVRVPVEPLPPEDAMAATLALAGRAAALDPDVATTEFIRRDRGGRVFVDATRTGGATLVAAWSPRARPGVPVSYPVAWDELPGLDPRAFTVRTVPGLVGGADPWASGRPAAAPVPAELLAEGHALPVPRVAALHEGLRRARRERATRSSGDE